MTDKTFGSWLKLHRIALDLSQQELADQAGCSVVTIRKIESDERSAFIAFARNEDPQLDHLSLDASPWQSATDTVQPQSSRLPKPPTPFIGRQVELAVIQKQLKNPDCQLLTLVGPGGMGKTRLALAVAEGQMDQARFADGVYFVGLTGLRLPEHIAPAIAEAIGFPLSGKGEPETQLCRYLEDKAMLLVLDNFEHLLAGTALLTRLQTAAPKLKLLTTSRERLNLRREWLYELPGLTYPQTAADAVELELYSAVQLFLSHAQQTSATFALAPVDQSHLPRICRAVDGLPLGLELAAAWTRVLSLSRSKFQVLRENSG